VRKERWCREFFPKNVFSNCSEFLFVIIGAAHSPCSRHRGSVPDTIDERMGVVKARFRAPGRGEKQNRRWRRVGALTGQRSMRFATDPALVGGVTAKIG
jgi:hypothetical protein